MSIRNAAVTVQISIAGRKFRAKARSREASAALPHGENENAEQLHAAMHRVSIDRATR